MMYNPIFIYPKNETDAMNELMSVGAKIESIRRKRLIDNKTVIRVEDVPLKAAWQLKQTLLLKGQECIIHEDAEQLDAEQTDAILLGNPYGIKSAVNLLLESEMKDVTQLGAEIDRLLMAEEMKHQPWMIQFHDSTVDLNERTWIMGILNVTPDSFSDGGNFDSVERAVEHAQEMVQAGADIIDIGGESTRPGADKVTVEEELERVVPIIKAVREAVDVAISIDTYKAEVAKQAIEAGANIINDIWGAKADPQMAQVAADYQVPIILMHNREDKNYNHLMSDIARDLRDSIALVKDAGVKDENIILDPGIGFAKTYEDNLDVMSNLEVLTALGYPVILGTSRKSFIGRVLQTETNERMEGTGATTCLGIQKGCQLVRVHDVLENKRMAMMMDAMLMKKGAVQNG
jgi:dihydropteroate synthase